MFINGSMFSISAYCYHPETQNREKCTEQLFWANGYMDTESNLKVVSKQKVNHESLYREGRKYNNLLAQTDFKQFMHISTMFLKVLQNNSYPSSIFL